MIDSTQDKTFCFFTKLLINKIIVKTMNTRQIAYRNISPGILYSENILFAIVPIKDERNLEKNEMPKESIYNIYRDSSEMKEKTKLHIKFAIFINITPYVMYNDSFINKP